MQEIHYGIIYLLLEPSLGNHFSRLCAPSLGWIGHIAQESRHGRSDFQVTCAAAIVPFRHISTARFSLSRHRRYGTRQPLRSTPSFMVVTGSLILLSIPCNRMQTLSSQTRLHVLLQDETLETLRTACYTTPVYSNTARLDITASPVKCTSDVDCLWNSRS